MKCNMELKKLLIGKNAQKVVDKYLDVLKSVVSIKGIPDKISKLPLDLPMRFTCLCGDAVMESLEFLCADNKTKHVCSVLSGSASLPKDVVELKRYISKLGREDATRVVTYRSMLYGEDKNEVAKNLLASDECMFISDLAVNGNDLTAIGFKGKSIGASLDKLLSYVIEGKCENKKESLLAIAKNIDNRK